MPDPYSGQGTDTQWLTDISAGIGIGEGIASGTPKGELSAAVSATRLASGRGAFGGSSGTVGGIAADVGNVAGIYTGIRRGGVEGYTSAGLNTTALGARTAGMLAKEGAFGAESGAVGSTAGTVASVAGYGAAALSLYEFAKNWQSGATGQEALQGAETGASVGTAIEPGVGTVVGAVVGAAAGAISSIFGPGREDPENVGWNEYASAYKQGGAAGVAGASPATNFQMLAGIFDSRGTSIPFYGKFGRMGEGKFSTAMFNQVNSAIKSGKVASNATPQQIYSQVVQPWINSMSPNGWQDTKTKDGASEKQAIGNLLTSFIGQWQQGQFNGRTPLGIEGQAMGGGFVPYAGQGGPSPQQQQQQQQITAHFQPLVNTLTGIFSVRARH